jgi:hypothetical protein
MNTKKILPILGIFLILIASPLVVAQAEEFKRNKAQGLRQVETSGLAVKVTAGGNVPHFHFWDPNSNETDYHVLFARLFEVNDTNDNGAYDKGEDSPVGTPLALPSQGWDVSDFNVVNDESIHFNFTHEPDTGVGIPSDIAGEVYIQLRVHLYAANPDELKFDILISDWDWESNETLLVLHFTVSLSDHGEEQGQRAPDNVNATQTEFQFNQAYMGYNETAKLRNNNTVQVGGSSAAGDGQGDNDKNSIYLAFENFQGETLEYDPTLGISAETEPTDGEEEPIIGSPAIWIGLSIGATLGLLLIIQKLKYKSK